MVKKIISTFDAPPTTTTTNISTAKQLDVTSKKSSVLYYIISDEIYFLTIVNDLYIL
ncbi:hypothetical protein PIROE2DRAFT_12800 [Piromyces sp. E2]|nr:hypothetical protein PIROE2DRAFT_12800 [Piromyces sp. E2]|eukprot:OUM61259.1 hypothetical protein PIROE2DRAFT_12800 [Piromyces sp. E2]